MSVVPGLALQPVSLVPGLHFLDSVYAPSSVVIASLGAACCYAVAAVLQQSAAADQRAELSLRPALLLALLRHRRWLVGILASLAGYVFQFLALRRGALALVEPLLVASLVVALPLSAVAEHRRLTNREWAPGLLIVVSLSLFLVAARPGPGRPHAGTAAWIVLGCVTVGALAACIRLAGPTRGRRRAVLLGTGAGLLFGVTGALTETTGHLLDHGIVHVFASWTPYALVLAGVGALILNQSAFQAGRLEWCLPVMTILEPLSAIVIGEFMFGEHIAGGALARTGEVVGLAGMTLGVFALARAHPASTPPQPVERSGNAR